jgi:predicted outer membrane repeat protein
VYINSDQEAAQGGAISGGAADSSFSIDSSVFVNNSAIRQAGAIVVSDGHVQITNSVFQRNTAPTGGALQLGNQDGSSYIRNVSFIENSAPITGGAVQLDTAVQCVMQDSEFTANEAQSGAAVFVDVDSNVTLQSCTFSGNGGTSTLSGGAIAADRQQQLTVSNCTFESSTALTGGCIHNDLGPVSMVNSRFKSCSAVADGGALWSSYSAIVSSTTFTANTARFGAGVYLVDAQAQVQFTNTVFDSNSASKAGAAVFQYSYDTPLLLPAADTVYRNNVAKCCHSNGFGSSKAWLRDANSSCVDFDTGAERQCCVSGEYISADKQCTHCTNSFDCKAVGTSLTTLSMPYGFWRESLTQLTVRECWNKQACIGGAAFNSTNDYCVEGYKGPCE